MTISKKELFQLTSPIAGALYSFILYLFFIFIPPSIYEYYVNEPDLMFMDFRAILFVLSCTIAFIAGAFIVGLLPKLKLHMKKLKKIKLSQNVYLSFPLLMIMVITIYFFFLLILNNLSLLPFILIGQGNMIKEYMDVPSLLSPFFYVFVGTFFWFFNNYLQLQNKTLYLKSLVWLSFILVFSISIIMVARYILMPFLLSIFIIYIYSSKQISVTLVIKVFILIILLFSLFTIMRGGDVISNIFGYVPASYNRLSAVLAGKIHFKYKWYYISTYFDGHPNNLDVLYNEHNAIANAGLNIYLNWISVYGYIYMVLGWLSFIYFFLLGFFMQIIWNLFRLGNTIGKVAYPWFFTLILLWFSFNMFSWATTIIFLLTGILLLIYGKLFTNNTYMKVKNDFVYNS